MEKSSIFSEKEFTKMFYDEIIDPVLTSIQKEIYTLLEEQNLFAHNLAKKGEFVKSLNIFLEIENQLLSHNYPTPLKEMLQEAYYPKKAYYYYKLKEFNAAKYCTQKSLALNDDLKKTFKNNDLFLLIQVQQYINLSKILSAKKELTKSFDIIYKLLRFLLLNELNLDHLDKYVNVNYQKLKIAMTYSVIFEAIILLQKTNTKAERTTFKFALTNVLQDIQKVLNTLDNRDNMMSVLIGFISILISTRKDLKSEKQYIEEFCKENAGQLFPNSSKILRMFATN